MHPMLRYYKQTWWVWLALCVTFIVLGIKVSFLFFIFLPALLAYSIYFGMIRVSEHGDQI